MTGGTIRHQVILHQDGTRNRVGDITLLKARLKDQGCISRSRHPKLSKTQEEAEEDVLPAWQERAYAAAQKRSAVDPERGTADRKRNRA